MDRNAIFLVLVQNACVALRKESVDRNFVSPIDVMSASAVALRKESVDRNVEAFIHFHGWMPSLSARRAWIEMLQHCWSILP